MYAITTDKALPYLSLKKHTIPDDGVQQCSCSTPGIRDGVSYGVTMRGGSEPGDLAMGERVYRMSCSAA